MVLFKITWRDVNGNYHTDYMKNIQQLKRRWDELKEYFKISKAMPIIMAYMFNSDVEQNGTILQYNDIASIHSSKNLRYKLSHI